MAFYEMDQYKCCIVPFIESLHFYMLELVPKASYEENRDSSLEIESHKVVMKFPSKHRAHTLL